MNNPTNKSVKNKSQKGPKTSRAALALLITSLALGASAVRYASTPPNSHLPSKKKPSARPQGSSHSSLWDTSLASPQDSFSAGDQEVLPQPQPQLQPQLQPQPQPQQQPQQMPPQMPQQQPQQMPPQMPQQMPQQMPLQMPQQMLQDLKTTLDHTIRNNSDIRNNPVVVQNKTSNKCKRGGRYAFKTDGLVVPVVAFYFPGEDAPWDTFCNCGFLGNFFDVKYALPNGIIIKPPGGTRLTHSFHNAEAAFQALKFWNNAQEFATVSGRTAFQYKKDPPPRFQATDLTYAGYGSNWSGMLAVLKAKFPSDMKNKLTMGLLGTGEDFLLEHNSKEGLDKIWSDDYTGTGKNWLGLQLMLIRRERLRELYKKESPWVGIIEQVWKLDSNTGLFPPQGTVYWQKFVQAARDAVFSLHVYNPDTGNITTRH